MCICSISTSTVHPVLCIIQSPAAAIPLFSYMRALLSSHETLCFDLVASRSRTFIRFDLFQRPAGVKSAPSSLFFNLFFFSLLDISQIAGFFDLSAGVSGTNYKGTLPEQQSRVYIKFTQFVATAVDTRDYEDLCFDRKFLRALNGRSNPVCKSVTPGKSVTPAQLAACHRVTRCPISGRIDQQIIISASHHHYLSMHLRAPCASDPQRRLIPADPPPLSFVRRCYCANTP